MPNPTVPAAAPGLPVSQKPSRRAFLKAGTTAATAALVAVPVAILPNEADAAWEAARDLLPADPFLLRSNAALEALDELYDAYDHWAEVEAACSAISGSRESAADSENGLVEWVGRRHRAVSEFGYAEAHRTWRAAADVYLDECAAIREVPATTLAGAVAKTRLANADTKMLPFLLQDLEQMLIRQQVGGGS
ncbi:twin-arginine translocation signal domain-containing protein [Xanthobacter autotrophicus]|uniref:twin-arginine translocation signal domain-containing protein n=1 Tax=Xanthobacter autotrophicus TaxID=280 RepID=UPI00372BDD22